MPYSGQVIVEAYIQNKALGFVGPTQILTTRKEPNLSYKNIRRHIMITWLFQSHSPIYITTINFITNTPKDNGDEH